MKTAKYIEIEDRFGAHNYHPLDIVIKKAEGVWVEDVEGQRYIDFLAAYSAVNQGHCHPRLLKTLRRQAAKVTLTSRAFRNDQLPWNRRDHGLFVAFAPYDKPKYAIATVVEHGGGGSTAAAPPSRDILLYALYGDVPPLEAYPAAVRDRIAEQQRRIEARVPPRR